MNNNYNNMSDEELLEAIKKDDTQALDFLICKYKDLVNSKVNKYFIIGAEKEDIIQEGLIGLYKAIKDYKLINENDKIAEILINELEEFYQECIVRTKKSSINFYNNVFPLHFINMKNAYENAKKKYNEANDKLNLMLNDNYNDISKFMVSLYSAKGEYQKKMSAYLKLKHFKNKYPTVQDFVDYSLKELENRHNKNIITLADRINRKHINIEKMKVISVKVDPNLYDMTITDDVEYLHCRSIWCAQYSDKVTPHYRFIIS